MTAVPPPAAAPVVGLPVAHLDLDSFFASVEERCKPSLRGRPVVVAGLGERGVVTTASYPARVFGVGSAMPTWQARRLAPNAAWLSPRGGAYSQYSQAAFAWVREAFGRVEQVSVDEAYLDLTSGTPELVDLAARDPHAVASLVRQQVWEATGLTCSVGVARSKLGAKLGSEQAKPAGVRVLAPADLEELLVDLSVRALPGVGPVTADRLRTLGVSVVADLRSRGEADLVAALGSAHGRSLWALAQGQDDRTVQPQRIRRSVGAERTFSRDLGTVQAVVAELPTVFAEAFDRLGRTAGAAGTVTVKLRYADFSLETRAASLVVATPDRDELWQAANRALASTNAPGPGVRLLGVVFSGLEDQVQLALRWDDDPAWVPSADPGQEPLDDEGRSGSTEPGGVLRPGPVPGAPVAVGAPAGCDVQHPVHGRGWLLGARGTTASVRFEEAGSPSATTRVVALDGHLRHAPPAPVLPAQLGEVPPWERPDVPPSIIL